ncbi:uncharacterized protein BDR25DRAFT_375139 [Lindgomyces ingoldianus]|uniref:Uncharacterized protein n=1 Tax=Lindgomyces ingoldianus TaxID=673940 RepID=A0ACB6RD80_9PLEO|nr:uncharacterized protein BDR25DRAFT_375139 [Lindgomyces ingoldianus]KAF2476287.1 hypothetical protein BDR25DRAFT_375139 [Lindgomyces ingoldianus]
MSVGSGHYRYDEPMLENYHDLDGGVVGVNSQIKLDSDEVKEAFSENAFQLWKEDKGNSVGELKQVAIADIVNEETLAKINNRLKVMQKGDKEWAQLDQGTQEFDEMIYSGNAKWAAFMLTDYHQAFGDLNILNIQIARETIFDGSFKGYMVFNIGARS